MLEKIKRLAESQGETITAVEKACGLAQGAIRKWEGSMPKADNLKKVADHFGVRIEYFLEG